MMASAEDRVVQVPEAGEDMRELIDAIQTFNRAAGSLRSSYNYLKKEVRRLNGELEQKNVELEQNLADKERAQNYLRNILESLKTAVMVVDRHGRLTTMNKSAGDLVGVRLEEAGGQRLETLLEPHLADPATALLLKEKDDVNGHECEIRWRSGGGQSLHIHLITSMMNDSSGTPLGKIYLLQDVTNLRRLEDQLQRSTRMAAMGELAVKIAHDVRNSLGSIELIASLLRKELEYDEDKMRLTEHIMVSIRNLDHSIANLLMFTRSPQPKREAIALHALLEETVEFIHFRLAYSNICMKKDFENGELTILGDRELLEQAFFNVILNAAQAMEGGGNLEIFTRTSGAKSVNWNSRAMCGRPLRNDVDQWVEIGFKDTGPGIPEEHLPKIFDPFFTTKEGCNGLGLAIVHNIVEAHGGLVYADGLKGTGSLFKISLPLLRTEMSH